MIRIKYILLSLFTSLLLFSIQAQVVINEYSCSNTNTISDNYNQYEDWFELYNTSSSTVNIGGFYLSDNNNNPDKWQIPSGTTIAGNSFLLVFASGRGESTGGYLHPNFKLTQMKQEHIVFSDASGNIIDILQLIPTQINHSRGRITDGASSLALFTNPTPNASNTGAMLNYAMKPVFSLPAGLYTNSISVTLTSVEPNITIHYTTNGTTPNASSPVASSAIAINTTTVIRAIAISSNPNVPKSFIETNTYFINDAHTIPVLSICGNGVANLLNGSISNPVGSFEYFNSNQELIDEATGDFNKHGNDSWAYPQRGFDFVVRDQYGYNYAIQDEIFNGTNRDEFQRLIIKAAANDNYPSSNGGAHIRDAYVQTLSMLGNLKLDERKYEACILYLDGQYWGVYDMREKADDHDYTKYYYDQSKNNLQYLKTWGGTWSEYGGAQAQTDWNDFRAFVLANDMTIQSNFDYVDSVYNWKSLIDYVVLNSYIVCSDWLNWNTAWWRGMDHNGHHKKWGYVLWDMDASFGHYINYTGIPDVTIGADPCNPEFLNNPGGQGHIPILNKLMENESFNQYYISRYIDLSNTTFSCTYMQYVLDSLIDIIQPEMQRHINKWGGTYTEWETNVQSLKDFIDGRCAELASGLIDCYDVTGPFDIMFDVQPAEAGEVKVNSIWIDSYPYTGTYFGDIDVILKAEPASNYIFDHWELINHTPSPGIGDENITLNLLTTDTIIAVFMNPTPYIELGDDTAICEGTSIILDAGNQGASYIWQDGSTDQTYMVSNEGTYTVEISNMGFVFVDSVSVSLIYPPFVDLGSSQQICPYQTITLSANTDADFFNWQDGSTDNYFEVTEPGLYWLEAGNICGNSRDSIEIFEGTTPEVNLGEDFNIKPDETAVLNATTFDASYVWQDNSTSPSFLVTEPGVYWVLVSNSCGSSYDDITIGCDCDVYIPNAFSPNGDGLNDEFVISGKGIIADQFTILIFDRWGEIVFTSNNIHNSWDGKINGKLVKSTGMFNYLLRYKTFSGEEKSITGQIYLLK